MIEFVMRFNTNKVCQQHLAKKRWNGKIICPYCNQSKIYYFKDGLRYKCAGCKTRFNAKTGTIFQNTKIPMPKWFLACYLLVNNKKGISSMQLAKDINVTQKTAWNMLRSIRTMFIDKKILSGIVEVDETYIGGKQKNKHRKNRKKGTQGRSLISKAAALGILERNGRVKAFHVQNVQLITLRPIVQDNVKTGSKIMTDEYEVYKRIPGYKHGFCNHSAKQYSSGDIHCNGMENFWSLVKRTIVGIYHWVSKKYLQEYLNEFCFRYNTRKMIGIERVNKVFGMI